LLLLAVVNIKSDRARSMLDVRCSAVKNKAPAAGQGGEDFGRRAQTSNADATASRRTSRRTSAVKFFSERLRKKSRAGAPPIAGIRIAELSRIFFDRYRGPTLSDDDAGQGDAWIMAHHIAHTRGGAPLIRDWLARCAPWMSAGDVDGLVATCMSNPRCWRADELAKLIGLRLADRTRLGITTIGAIDCNLRQRQRARLDRKRDASRARRRQVKRGQQA
jgi:hypothetical protein